MFGFFRREKTYDDTQAGRSKKMFDLSYSLTGYLKGCFKDTMIVEIADPSAFLKTVGDRDPDGNVGLTINVKAGLMVMETFVQSVNRIYDDDFEPEFVRASTAFLIENIFFEGQKSPSPAIADRLLLARHLLVEKAKELEAEDRDATEEEADELRVFLAAVEAAEDFAKKYKEDPRGAHRPPGRIYDAIREIVA